MPCTSRKPVLIWIIVLFSCYFFDGLKKRWTERVRKQSRKQLLKSLWFEASDTGLRKAVTRVVPGNANYV